MDAFLVDFLKLSWRRIFCFVNGMVGRPDPGHRQVSPAAPGGEQNMPLLGRPRAPAKNPSKLAERRHADNENGTSHQPIPRSLVVAPYCAGQIVPETDWATWQLSGQGPQSRHFPLEFFMKGFTFGVPGLQSQISRVWPGFQKPPLSS